MDKQRPQVSVVVPLLNEQENIGPLYEQITQTLTDVYDYEIIFVDDGSSDNSFDILAKLQKTDAGKKDCEGPRLAGIQHIGFVT